MNIKNLKIGGQYLIDNAEKIQPHFDMGDYRADASGEAIFMPTPWCGTIGCALGTLAASGIPELTVNRKDWGGWIKYSKDIFDVSSSSAEWQYMFSSYWAAIDNTAKGAGERMLFVARNFELGKSASK